MQEHPRVGVLLRLMADIELPDDEIDAIVEEYLKRRKAKLAGA